MMADSRRVNAIRDRLWPTGLRCKGSVGDFTTSYRESVIAQAGRSKPLDSPTAMSLNAAVVAYFAKALAEWLLATLKLGMSVFAYFAHKPRSTPETGLVLVTGAARGLGKSIITTLAKHSKLTVVAGVRKIADGERLKAEVPDLKYTIELDVGDPHSVSRAADDLRRISSESGLGLVAVVNNAGLAPPQILELTSEDFIDHVMNVNFKGAIRVIQAFLPMLRETKGRIVNISSASSEVNFVPCMSIYHASKAALDMCADVLRSEVMNQGITVVSVRPGAMATQMLTNAGVVDSPVCEGVPSETTALYSRTIEAHTKMDRMATAVTPESMATNTVLHAVTSPRPLAVYYWGPDSVIFCLVASILPATLSARIIAKTAYK